MKSELFRLVRSSGRLGLRQGHEWYEASEMCLHHHENVTEAEGFCVNIHNLKHFTTSLHSDIPAPLI